MTRWLLDTNVVSELRRSSPSHRVLNFVYARPLHELCISTVTLAEIRFGIELAVDPSHRAELERWLGGVIRPMFTRRVLAITEDIMLRWRLLVEDGRKTGRTFPQPDLILAATALEHDLTIVTRNVADFCRTWPNDPEPLGLAGMKLGSQGALSCRCGREKMLALGLCATCYTLKRHDEEYFGGLREAVLERDGYTCRVCGASGRDKRSITVHHRVPGKSKLSLLISLCPGCHAKVHRTKAALSEMSPLLLQLWREQHPHGQEQFRLDFTSLAAPAQSLALPINADLDL